MQPNALLIWQNFIISKKWVLQGDPPPGGGSVQESSSRHNVDGLAWKREQRWGKVVVGALRCSYL
jgi:hypothetical protein